MLEMVGFIKKSNSHPISVLIHVDITYRKIDIKGILNLNLI